MTGPAKGEKSPLLHSLKARQRVLVGLSWDARPDEVGFMGRILKKDSQHDLDVTAFVFDKNGEYMDFVGAEAQDSMDQSGKIYHSGDDMSGEGGGDDEFINAELAELPGDIGHIVYLVEVRSNHTLGDIDEGNIRLADGMTETNLLETSFGQGDGSKAAAFIFARIFRSLGSDTGWMLHNISEYPDISQIQDWGSYLKKYLN